MDKNVHDIWRFVKVRCDECTLKCVIVFDEYFDHVSYIMILKVYHSNLFGTQALQLLVRLVCGVFTQ